MHFHALRASSDTKHQDEVLKIHPVQKMTSAGRARGIMAGKSLRTYGRHMGKITMK